MKYITFETEVFYEVLDTTTTHTFKISKENTAKENKEALVYILNEFFVDEYSTDTIDISNLPWYLGRDNVKFTNQFISGNLYQEEHVVKGEVNQYGHNVDGDIHQQQTDYNVGGKIYSI